MTSSLADAYSRTGRAWQEGPGVVYDRLADVALERAPRELAGARVLDLGAGTGAASRAALRRGADVVAMDVALGMLSSDAAARPPAAVGDALALPFAPGAFDGVVAAFSLNHVEDPARALREVGRVVAPGGWLVATAYAEDDTHPVKGAVEAALVSAGWTTPPWYAALRREAVPLLATVERAALAAADAGLVGARAEHVTVPFPQLGARALVEWRLGMAQTAPFVTRLTAAEREAVLTDALTRLGPAPPTLVRSMIVLSCGTWRNTPRSTRQNDEEG